MECILYRKGYKYQLSTRYVTVIDIKPKKAIKTEYIALTTKGKLTISKGYAWDGPSGPTIDTLNFMRGSLVHDALYQLIREGHLDIDQYRDDADRLLRNLCREDGMSAARALWVYLAVRAAGRPAADPASSKPPTYAPQPC
jgi:hypothetical protein